MNEMISQSVHRVVYSSCVVLSTYKTRFEKFKLIK